MTLSARSHRLITLLAATATFGATVIAAIVTASAGGDATVAAVIAAAFGAAFTALPTLIREMQDPSGGSTPPSGT